MVNKKRVPFQKRMAIWEAVVVQGKTMAEVAEFEGVSKTTISRIASGKKPVDEVTHYTKTTPEERQIILELYEKGEEIPQIAQRIKRAHATVSGQVAKYKADPELYRKTQLPAKVEAPVEGNNLETFIAGATRIFQEWSVLKKENEELKGKLARVAEAL